MAEANFIENQKCVLCYNYLDCEELPPPLLTKLQSIMSTCVKHIPSDICPTESWNQFDGYDVRNVSSIFCKKCYDSVSKLSKLNKDLEEIQTKICELVDLLVSHVKLQRKQHCGYSTPDYCKTEATTTGVYCSNNSQNRKENGHEIIKQSFSLNGYPEGENDAEFADSLDLGNTECENSDEEVAQPASKNTNCVSQNYVSALKPFVGAPVHVKPKSGLQKILEGSSGHPCPTCHKMFSRYTIMKKHDCSKPTVECEICGMSFSGGGVLKIHIRSHTGEKPYKCETCGKAFSIKANLKEHLNVHTKERKFECDICQKSFRQENCMIMHKSRVHTRVEDKLFKCDVCSKKFKTLGELKSHLVKHSTGTLRPFKCDICEKTYADAGAVIIHIRKHHSKEELPLKCHICEKRFINNSNLKQHMLSHIEDKQFQCSYCGKSFKSESYWKVHESTHTVKETFDCTTCGKSFKASFHLIVHQRRHKDINQICELCGKSVSSIGMKGHLKGVHGNEIERRPFGCEICELRFTNKKSRIFHYKQYCHICSTYVQRNITLLAHQIEVHTVNSAFYPEDSDELVVAKKRKRNRKLSKEKTSENLPQRRSRRDKSKKKINYDESSSEGISDNPDFDGSSDKDSKMDTSEHFKVEVKSEDEFSEIEDEFTQTDVF